MKSQHLLIFLFIIPVILNISCSSKKENSVDMDNLYPWCIVAFDSLERSPSERVKMLKRMGFEKYAYDWRDKHISETESELKLAQENGIEIISVWLWLNAERDTIGKLNPSNEKLFQILKNLHLNTTFWVSFSNNFFEGQSQEQSVFTATEMINYIYTKADEIGCKIALYNHRGWFGDLDNQIEIIKSLPECNLSIVYNFHHAHQYLEDFPQIINKIKPYLSWVNLNGMLKDGPKILTIGAGTHEQDMIKHLMNVGYKGPWGILGHVENKDVKWVLEQNITGLNSLDLK